MSVVGSIFERMSEAIVGRAVAAPARLRDHAGLREHRAHQQAMAARLARIAKIERRVAALQAEQVHLTASFVADRIAFDDDHGFLSGPAQYRGMVAEVAIARNVSVTTAAAYMDDAYRLATAHPATMAALATGRIGLSAARAIVRETVVLNDPKAKALADQVIAEEAPDLLPGKVRPMAERVVAEVDPAPRSGARKPNALTNTFLSPRPGPGWRG
jgi:hypothetical protein